MHASNTLNALWKLPIQNDHFLITIIGSSIFSISKLAKYLSSGLVLSLLAFIFCSSSAYFLNPGSEEWINLYSSPAST
jgi:hypothetical protein